MGNVRRNNKEHENDDGIQRGQEMRKKMEMMMGDREVIGNTKENKNDDGRGKEVRK